MRVTEQWSTWTPAPWWRSSATSRNKAVNARIVVRISHFHGVLALVTSTGLIATIPARLARTIAQYANIKVFPPPIPFPKSRTSLYWHERFHREPGNAWLRSEHFRLIK
ncbi:MAG: hypothetical protein EXR28_07870 [Betaproteobacteria bacterium]|nr:hypothetical protein [Betaproteobacteria bacterium]